MAELPVVFAHGVGGRSDLPVPVWLFAYGAAFALLISFVALRILWPRPRLSALSSGMALPDAVQRVRPVLAVGLRVVGLVFFAVTVAAAAFGSTDGGLNVAPYAMCVIFWVGVPIASALVGDVFAAANPFDTIAFALRLPDETVWRDPGLWPAAVMIFSFTWLELAYYNGCSDPVALSWWLGTYTVATIAGATLWGRTWLRTGEGFAALFGLIAHLAPLYRDPETGQLRLRMPLSGLASVQQRPGTLALVLVALGSTTFDGFSRTRFWGDIIGQRVGWDRTLVSTFGLLWLVGIVATAWLGATRLTARMTGREPTDIANAFLASLIPITLGYAIAHYFSLLVFDGQNFIALASDPFFRGWNLFGTIDNSVNYRLVSTRTIAYVQVAAIVGGHVCGVIAAHDRAVELFPPRQAVRSQYPLLAVMILYTVGGLLLLLGG
ncbi:MAG: hypothetical protein QOI95_2784 [Acidimicrobiaceae bacterium]